jgi:hypothetical protein
MDHAILLIVMPTPRKHNYAYPNKTRGSEMARRIRADANMLTTSERAEIHRRAMQVIYTRTTNKETVRSGQ